MNDTGARRAPSALIRSLAASGHTEDQILDALIDEGEADLRSMALIGVALMTRNIRRNEARAAEDKAMAARDRREDRIWKIQMKKASARRLQSQQEGREIAQQRRDAEHDAFVEMYGTLTLQVAEAREEFASKLRMEWTAELLALSFDVGEGRRVTWGEATEADHLARIDLLDKKAAGTLAAAARHTVAIADLRSARVSCLAEMTP